MRSRKHTIRQMMISVAVTAFAMAAYQAVVRSGTYRERAAFHESRLATLEIIRIQGYPSYCSWGSQFSVPLSNDPQLALLHRKSVAYHSELVRVYRQAAKFPWISVPIEPPAPSP